MELTVERLLDHLLKSPLGIGRVRIRSTGAPKPVEGMAGISQQGLIPVEVKGENLPKTEPGGEKPRKATAGIVMGGSEETLVIKPEGRTEVQGEKGLVKENLIDQLENQVIPAIGVSPRESLGGIGDVN